MKYSHRLYSKSEKSKNFWLLSVIIFFGIFIFYGFLRPQDTGILGQQINEIFYKFCGVSRFFIPVLIFYWVWYNIKSKKHNIKASILFSILLFVLFSGIVKVVCNIFNFSGKNAGWLGENVLLVFSKIFGELFGSIAIVVLFFYVISLLFELSITEIIYDAYIAISEDIQSWRKEVEIAKAKKRVEQEVSQAKKVSRYADRHNTTSKETIPIYNTIKDKTILMASKEKSEDKEKSFTSAITNRPITTPREKVIKKSEELPDKYVSTIKKDESVLNYKLPSLDFLSLPKEKVYPQMDVSSRVTLLESTLREFEIESKVVNVTTGPVVTLYELELQPGVKVQSVVSLKDNIALAMRADSIRIIAPLADRGTIGIEIPNPKTRVVSLREVLESKEYLELSSKMTLPIAIGKTVDGRSYVSDITTMPHLLVAGATGSGKSVGIHTIIMSLLYKCPPNKLKFLMIDPKRLELTVYNDIPHIYDPIKEPQNASVITSPKDAAKSLSALVRIMEQRYEKFAHIGVRNIEGYNEKMRKDGKTEEYYILVVIDEFADLILTVPKEVEDSIQRLSQMARAVGIHIILATQRPSVDVITGVIKANFSARIAFQVLSKTDSRVILDTIGAEELLGKGDMLFLPSGEPRPIRLQGAYVSEEDISKVVDFIKSQNIPKVYDETLAKVASYDIPLEKVAKQTEDLIKALKLIKERNRVSQDLLKAHFGSSSKATDLLSLLEVRGFIYKPEGTNRWQINFDKIDEELKSLETKIS